MKHLEELIKIMIKLGIIENKDEFYARFTANDPLEDAKRLGNKLTMEV